MLVYVVHSVYEKLEMFQLVSAGEYEVQEERVGGGGVTLLFFMQ